MKHCNVATLKHCNTVTLIKKVAMHLPEKTDLMVSVFLLLLFLSAIAVSVVIIVWLVLKNLILKFLVRSNEKIRSFVKEHGLFTYLLILSAVLFSIFNPGRKFVPKCKKNDGLNFKFYVEELENIKDEKTGKVYTNYDLYFLPSCVSNDKKIIKATLDYSQKVMDTILPKLTGKNYANISFIRGTKHFETFGGYDDHDWMDYDRNYIAEHLIIISYKFYRDKFNYFYIPDRYYDSTYSYKIRIDTLSDPKKVYMTVGYNQLNLNVLYLLYRYIYMQDSLLKRYQKVNYYLLKPGSDSSEVIFKFYNHRYAFDIIIN